jgi:hypothetical protein
MKARIVFTSLTATGCVHFSTDSCHCNFTEVQVLQTVFLGDYDSCMILILHYPLNHRTLLQLNPLKRAWNG